MFQLTSSVPSALSSLFTNPVLNEKQADVNDDTPVVSLSTIYFRFISLCLLYVFICLCYEIVIYFLCGRICSTNPSKHLFVRFISLCLLCFYLSIKLYIFCVERFASQICLITNSLCIYLSL